MVSMIGLRRTTTTGVRICPSTNGTVDRDEVGQLFGDSRIAIPSTPQQCGPAGEWLIGEEDCMTRGLITTSGQSLVSRLLPSSSLAIPRF